MTSTSVRAGRGADQTHPSDTRTADTSALRAASRQLLATAGNQVLKAAVDRAVGRIDQAAGRLDAMAAGEGRARRGTPTRKPAERPSGGGQQAGRPGQVRMGAAFSLVVHQAARILQLVRRLAQQLIAALARLIRRADTADTQIPAEKPVEPRRADRAVPRERIEQDERTAGRRDASDTGSAASRARSPEAAQRPRSRPATEPESPRRRAAPKTTPEDRQG
jgi:hypothetical protein